MSWSASEAGLLTPSVSEERGTAVRIRSDGGALLFAREGNGPESLREVVRDASRRAGGAPFLKARPAAPRRGGGAPAAMAEEETALLSSALARALPDPRGLSLELTVSRVSVTRAVITSRSFFPCGTSVRLLATGLVRRTAGTRPFAFQSAAPYPAAVHALALALKAAARPVAATPAPDGPVDVVLAPAAASVFWHEVVGHPLEAEGGARHSALARVAHAAVAPPGLDVTDDPLLPHLPGSYGYDDEGIPARRVSLIENGRVHGFLTDRRTGGDESNGHGRASDYRRPPRPRLSNLTVAPGNSPLEELLERCATGLLVHEIAAGSLEPESGRFLLLVASAESIRRGRTGAPVSPFALSGDALSALRELDQARGDTALPAEGLGLCMKGGEAVPVGGVSPAILLRALRASAGRS